MYEQQQTLISEAPYTHVSPEYGDGYHDGFLARKAAAKSVQDKVDGASLALCGALGFVLGMIVAAFAV